LGIVFTTLAVYPIGRWWSGTTTGALVNYKGIFAAPDFSLLFQLDLAQLRV
jgi:adenine/guanine/hypoxanthine permease